MGTIFAHDDQQHRKWSSRQTRTSRALSGAALEAAIMNLASIFPDNVVRGAA